MTKSRLEAFSDGVFAIIITIMVLELKVPHDNSLDALVNLFPVFTSYILSFVFIAIYWANHHHFIHAVKRVNARIIWSNMGLLFTLSLVPFTTGWMGENHYAKLPVALYCMNLLICGFAAYFFQLAVTYKLPPNDKVFVIIQKNLKKTIFSVALYITSLICAFYYPFVSLILIILVAVVWVIPDRSIERLLEED